MPSKLVQQAPEQRVAGEAGGREVKWFVQGRTVTNIALQLKSLELTGTVPRLLPILPLQFVFLLRPQAFCLLFGQVVRVLRISRGCRVAWMDKEPLSVMWLEKPNNGHEETFLSVQRDYVL